MVLLGAFFWAGHILITDHFICSVSAAKLCTVQFFSGAVLNLICALLFERDSITLSNLSNALWAVCYCGLLSTGLGYLLQSLGQKDCPPAYAALILSLNGAPSAHPNAPKTSHIARPSVCVPMWANDAASLART